MNECDQLEKEINKLKYELSVVIPNDIQTSIQLGDLSENSEFCEVLSRQYVANIRLSQLTQRLSVCKEFTAHAIIPDVVNIGSLVRVSCKETKKKNVFKLIISELSDVQSDKFSEITLQSPLGKALKGRKVKDEVFVFLPTGKVTYKILDILTMDDL
jgi:transcription elongation factor GreA